MAECLYAAILTDTGSFNYPSTSASTFAMAEHLVQRGANPNRIAAEVYFSNPPSKVKLLGIALSNLQIEGAVSWSHVTLEEMERVGANVEDCEGVANHLIGIAGVEAAAFLRGAARAQSIPAKFAEPAGAGCVGNRREVWRWRASQCEWLQHEGTLEEVTLQIVEQMREACHTLRSERAAIEAPTLPSILLA